jgi:diadenosine tetraphosphate (Ap4A) HIT family hydrolase
MSFVLDPRLQSSTFQVGDLGLSRLLLMNDSRFLWLILAPRREGLTEIIDLEAPDRAALMEEIAALSQWLRRRAGTDKINVGALGNIVRQLHMHVIARRIGDPAWPGPAWGAGSARPYDADAASALAADIAQDLAGQGIVLQK